MCLNSASTVPGLTGTPYQRCAETLSGQFAHTHTHIHTLPPCVGETTSDVAHCGCVLFTCAMVAHTPNCEDIRELAHVRFTGAVATKSAGVHRTISVHLIRTYGGRPNQTWGKQAAPLSMRWLGMSCEGQDAAMVGCETIREEDRGRMGAGHQPLRRKLGFPSLWDRVCRLVHK